MELKPDNSRVLMSDALKGQLDETDDSSDPFSQLSSMAVYAVFNTWLNGEEAPMSGILRSMLFGTEPEIEVMVHLSEALNVVKAAVVEVRDIELQHGEELVIPMVGPWTIKAARIDNIDIAAQSCSLCLQLQRAN